MGRGEEEGGGGVGMWGEGGVVSKDGREPTRTASPFETPPSQPRRASQGEGGYLNLPRSCAASKSNAGPSGTIPVGLMCSMLM